MTVIDQGARDMASRAMNAVEAHERECAVNQRHILGNLDEIKGDIKALFDRFWVAAISVIALMISICGSLIYLIITRHG